MTTNYVQMVTLAAKLCGIIGNIGTVNVWALHRVSEGLITNAKFLLYHKSALGSRPKTKKLNAKWLKIECKNGYF